MNIHFRDFLFREWGMWGILAIALLAILHVPEVSAEPYLAVRSNQKCSACHVNPLGGGGRNSFGAYYGSQVLPGTAGDASAFDGGQISEMFRIGGDLRVNLNRSENDADQDAQGFNTQSGQLYVTIQPKGSRFTLYLDEQIAPGGALNREAWVLAKLGKSNHYIKAGTMMLPFGYRLEDDNAFGRVASRVTFDSNDTGVELGLEYAKFTFNFAVTNGSPSSTNPDTRFSYATRGEYVGNNIRGGASYLFNSTEQAGTEGETNMFAIFGGFNLWGMNFLTEFDSVAEEFNGIEVTQEALIFEINREIKKGYNLKLTFETLDPNTDVDNDNRDRNSILLEATPWANIQLRTGLRIYDDIPQREAGNGNEAFFQIHLYY